MFGYSRWLQKPSFGSQINWSNPLSKGLIQCWLFNEGGGNKIYSLGQEASKTTISFSGSPTWVPDGLFFDGIDDYVDTGCLITSSPLAFTIVLRVTPITLGGDKFILATPGGINQFNIYVSSNKLAWYGGGWSDPNFEIYFCPTGVNIPKVLAATMNSNIETRIYLNGVYVANDTSYTLTAHTEPIRFGTSTTNFASFIIHYCYIYNRVLTPFEIQSLYIDPYQIIRSPLPYYFFSGGEEIIYRDFSANIYTAVAIHG